MENSRTKNSALILTTGLIRQVSTILLTFVSRTVFIRVLGAEILGINGLFTNILTLLTLSELGIATAITFYLYEPIVQQNVERINQLMRFYRTCYRTVGCIIIGAGILLAPFLPYIVNFEQEVNINLYVVFLISVFNIASTYLFGGYKQTIFLANQEQYKAEKVNIIFAFLNCIAEITVLIIFKNYFIYLLTQLCMLILKNLCYVKIADKEYPYLKEKPQGKLDSKEIRKFFHDIYQVAIFKLGSQLLNATSNIVISVLLGTVIVGYYSNYYLIISAMVTLYGVIIRSFTAGIGNVIVKETKEKQYFVYKQLDFVNFITAAFFTICLAQLFNSFMRIWLGDVSSSYIFPQSVVVIISINYYFDTSCQILNTFREASGNFKVGYFLQVIAGIVNIVLSVIMGKLWGLQGILCSVLICKLGITIIPFIKSIANKVFQMSGQRFIICYMKNLLFTISSMLVIWYCCKPIHATNIFLFCLEIVITILIFCVLMMVIYRKNREFISIKNRIFVIIKNMVLHVKKKR